MSMSVIGTTRANDNLRQLYIRTKPKDNAEGRVDFPCVRLKDKRVAFALIDINLQGYKSSSHTKSFNLYLSCS